MRVSRSNGCKFVNGCCNPFERVVILTERIPEQLARLLKSFERIQIFCERLLQLFRTGGDFNRTDTRTLVYSYHNYVFVGHGTMAHMPWLLNQSKLAK